MCDGCIKKKTSAKDVNVNAFEILQILTRKPAEGPTKKKKPDKPEKLPADVVLGRWGGLKDGNARSASLMAKKRKEIAKKAALKRWNRG